MLKQKLEELGFKFNSDDNTIKEIKKLYNINERT